MILIDLRLFERGRIQIYGDTAEVGARVKCRQIEQLTAASNNLQRFEAGGLVELHILTPRLKSFDFSTL